MTEREYFLELMAEHRFLVSLRWLTLTERAELEALTDAQMRAELDAAGKLAPVGGVA
jgi:hypothetical protein